MTVFMYQRPPALGGEERGASSRSVAREEVSAAGGLIGSTREEVGGPETWFLKWRHPGGGGCRHFMIDPLLREEERARGLSDLTLWEEETDPIRELFAVSGLKGDASDH